MSNVLLSPVGSSMCRSLDSSPNDVCQAQSSSEQSPYVACLDAQIGQVLGLSCHAVSDTLCLRVSMATAMQQVGPDLICKRGSYSCTASSMWQIPCRGHPCLNIVTIFLIHAKKNEDLELCFTVFCSARHDFLAIFMPAPSMLVRGARTSWPMHRRLKLRCCGAQGAT